MDNSRTSSDEPNSSDFSLRLVALAGEQSGALLFVTPTAKTIHAFLGHLIDTMFPAGGRSSSLLSVETRNDGVLLYEVRSRESLAKIALTGVPREVGVLVRNTLQEYGSLPLIFGFSHGHKIILIEPTKNHIIRTDAYVDQDYIDGSHVEPKDWSGFFRVIADENPTVPAKVDQ
jgi:hypothetical protein